MKIRKLGFLLLILLCGCTSTEDAMLPITPSIQAEDDTNPVNSEVITDNLSAVLKKRDPVAEEYFDEVVFLGDSRAVMVSDYNVVKSDVIASEGLSIQRWDIQKLTIKGVEEPMTLMEGLTLKQYKACYLIVGMNELGWVYPDVFKERLAARIDEIRMLQPSAALVLQLLYPVTKEQESHLIENEEQHRLRYNEIFKEIAEEKQVYLFDPAEVLADETGWLQTSLSDDGVHLNAAGAALWKTYLLSHPFPDNTVYPTEEVPQAYYLAPFVSLALSDDSLQLTIELYNRPESWALLEALPLKRELNHEKSYSWMAVDIETQPEDLAEQSVSEGSILLDFAKARLIFVTEASQYIKTEDQRVIGQISSEKEMLVQLNGRGQLIELD